MGELSYKIFTLILSILLLITGSVLFFKPHETNAVTLSIVSAITIDGTAAFDLDDTDGHDSSSTNGRVRTNDTVVYRVDWSVNDADVTSHQVVLTLGDGLIFENVPDVCLDGSVISADRKVLTCETGAHHEGENGIITAEAFALSSTPNNTAVSMTATAADSTGATATATQVNVVVTSAPMINMRKSLGAPTFLNGITDPNTGKVGRVGVWTVSFGPEIISGAVVKGAGPINSDFTFTDKLTQLSPGTKFLDFEVPELGPSGACGPQSVQSPYFPYGTIGIVPEASVINSSVNSGTWDCTLTNPTTLSISVTGADTTPQSVPNNSGTFDSLLPEQYLVTGQIATFTPEEDISSDITLTNVVSDFDPAGAGGIGSNYGADTEPTSDNTKNVTLRPPTTVGNTSGSQGLTFFNADAGMLLYPDGSSQTLKFPSYNPSYPYSTTLGIDQFFLGQLKTDVNNYPSGATVGVSRPGDSTLRPGDPLNAFLVGFLGLNSFDEFGMALCAQFDPALVRLRSDNDSYRLRTLTENLADFSTTALDTIDAGPYGLYFQNLLGHRFPGNIYHYYPVDNDKLVIEFGAGNSTDPEVLRLNTCQDDDAAGGWFSNPNDVPGGLSAVGQVRIRSDISFSQAFGSEIDPDATRRTRYLRGWLPMEVAPGVAAGTEVHAFNQMGFFYGEDLTTWSDIAWQGQNYLVDPHYSGTVTQYGGDQFFVADSIQSIDKSSAAEGKLVAAGAIVPWQIQVRVVGNAIAAQVVDTLPSEVSYIPGSANITPSSTSPLTFDLGNLSDEVVTINFDTKVNSGVTAETVITNRADLNSDLPATWDQASTTTRNVIANFGIIKAVDKNPIPTETDFSFDLIYENEGESKLGSVDMIDILPFNGDGQADTQRLSESNYHGSLKITSLIPSEKSERFFITKEDPNHIVMDTSHSSNILSSGSTKWCELIDVDSTPNIGDSGCPKDLSEATAFRFTTYSDLEVTEKRTVKVTLKPTANWGADIYANNFGGRIDGISLPIISNDVFIKVISPVIGDTVFLDKNKNGLQDKGETGIAGVTMELIGPDGKVIETTITDSNGNYSFIVPTNDEYTVRVADSNYNEGGILFGYYPTVDYTRDGKGDDKRTQKIEGFDILTYDFGFTVETEESVTNITQGPEKPEECQDIQPTESPNLFSVEKNGSEAVLYFVPVKDNTNKYHISYSENETAEDYGVEFNWEDAKGVVSFKIKDLKKDKDYYFKVRAGNGCAIGPWSSKMSSSEENNSLAQTGENNIFYLFVAIFLISSGGLLAVKFKNNL